MPGFGQLAALIKSVVAAKASNAVNVPVGARATTMILGAPQLTLTYRGSSPRPNSRILAQVVDDKTGKVLGNQITPIKVVLDGRQHTVRTPLEIVIAYAPRGSRFTVQLVAQSSQYNTFPAGGSVTFSKISVTLPTVSTT